MSERVCPRANCAEINPPDAIYCHACHCALIPEPRAARCVYCGRKLSRANAVTCMAHRDLVRKDPNVTARRKEVAT